MSLRTESVAVAAAKGGAQLYNLRAFVWNPGAVENTLAATTRVVAEVEYASGMRVTRVLRPGAVYHGGLMTRIWLWATGAGVLAIDTATEPDDDIAASPYDVPAPAPTVVYDVSSVAALDTGVITLPAGTRYVVAVPSGCNGNTPAGQWYAVRADGSQVQVNGPFNLGDNYAMGWGPAVLSGGMVNGTPLPVTTAIRFTHAAAGGNNRRLTIWAFP